jgi:DNA polymerase-1
MPADRPVLYLIDASSYLYRAFHALPPLTNAQGLPTNAVYGFTTMLRKLLRDSEARYVGAVFDAPGRTFRDEVYADYKAHREGMPADLRAQVPLVNEVLDALRIRRLCVEGVEADDVIGTLARRFAESGVDVVIVTGDKDLMQLVGPHVRLWDTMRDRWFDEAAVRERFGVGPDQVVEVMGLMGDSIDNIPGVRGIGEKTAKLLIARFGTIEQLLARVDEVEAAKDIRAAKQLAAKLRTGSAEARMSRDLAAIRCDVDVSCDLEQFHLSSADTPAVNDLFTRLGFQSLARDLASATPPLDCKARQIEDPASIETWCAAARRAGCVSMAIETEGEGSRSPARGMVLGADAAPLAHFVVAPGMPLPAAVVELLKDRSVEKVVHDLKRDLLALDPEVASCVGPAFDVMIAAYLLEVPTPDRLESVAANLLGLHLEKFRGTAAALANGVSTLGALREHCARQLAERQLAPLFNDVEMPLVRVLTAMERRGVRLDVAVLHEMSSEIESRLSSLVTQIYELAGGEFNISSPPQLREVLFDRLQLSRKGVRRGKTGLSTDVDVLTRLAADHPLPAKILEHRGLAKLKSTYVDALPAAVDPQTGRLHTSFNQTVAATGRLSSSDPNLQNVPIRGVEGRRIRSAFCAAEGHVLIGADYSQIELRLLAHFSNDPALVEAFRSGHDVHARTAAEVFGVLPGTVTPEMRRTAKVINFGILYGMGAQRLARELGIAVAEAERYIGSYFERYSGVRAYMEGVRMEAKELGYVTTLLGRRRSLPEISSRDRNLAQAAERTAINTPIQGSAADVIKLAMIGIDRRLEAENLQAHMILQVHDELLVETTERDVEAARAIVLAEMEGAYRLRVPLEVEVGIGRNWAEIH